MPKTTQAVAVTDDALSIRVKPAAALRSAWKTTALQVISLTASGILLVLGYLQTLSVANVLSPTQALLWIAGINIAQLLLRAFGVKPIVLDPPANVTVKSDQV